MQSKSIAAFPAASRVGHISYAIRNIVAEAKAVEARGTPVRYLNIGDPVAFGFKTPPHIIEAAERAMRDGYNGYLPSPGIPEGREAVADEYERRGVTVSPERVLLTAGTSEGIDLALTATVDEGDEVLVPCPTYPMYTAVLAKLGARARPYRTDPNNQWFPDLDHMQSLVSSRTRVLVTIDPNNPTGAVYPTRVRRAMIELAERNNLIILADEVYSELGYDGELPLLGTLDRDAPIISLSSLSKAYLAPGWRTGWLVAAPTPRLDEVMGAIRKLADGRLCSPGPMQYGVVAALRGDRSHQPAFRRALEERAKLTTERMCAIPGIRCTLPHAAFYALPSVALPPGRTDEHFILSLLRETGILCVHGSGFGMPPEQGYFRVVFLAEPKELSTIYDDLAAFTRRYLQNS